MITEKVPGINDRIRAQAKSQRLNSRLARGMVYFLLIVSFISLPVWSMSLLLGDIGPGMFSESPPYVGLVIIVLVYGTFFVFPFLLCLPVILPMALKQKNITRIVVFRKFNDEKCKRALSKIIRTNLAYYGHVFTLSDSKFKVKWYVRIPLFLGQLSLFHFRQRDINKPGQVTKFKNSLNNHTWLNINWLFSGNKVFPVKTNDAFWKDTARVLLDKNCLIIFDVSYNSASLDWEITETQKLGYEPNIIAVSSILNKAESINWKNRNDLPDDNEIPVFYYNDKGEIDEEEEFEKCIVNKLAGFYSDQDVLSFSRKYVIRRMVYTCGTVLFLFVGTLFFMSPYIIPDYVAMHSPFPKQVANAYIQSRLHNYTGNELVQGRIRGRIKKNKWTKKIASIMIKRADDHYRSECDAVRAALEELMDPNQADEYRKLALTGEPVIAETAFKIVQTINPGSINDIAFELMQSPRIYLRQRGIQLLEKVTMNGDLVDNMLFVLEDAPTEIKPEPYQHFPVEMLSGLSKFWHDHKYGDIREAEQEYFNKIYSLLDSSIRVTHIKKLKDLIKENNAPGLRIIAGMLLAKMNNAAGITLLSNATFIRGEDRIGFSFPEGITTTATYPYKKTADSLIFNLHQPADCATIEDILFTISSQPKDDLNQSNISSASLIVFIFRHYSTADITRFISGIAKEDTIQLPEALYFLLTHDLNRFRPLILKCIELSKETLSLVLASEDIDRRLNAALLLSYIGYVPVAEIAVDAGKIAEKLFFGTDYPYSARAEKILNILYANMQPPFNPKQFQNLRPRNYSAEQKILNRIIIKSKQKRKQ